MYAQRNRSRHVDRRYFKVRELVAESVVVVKLVKTADNVADILTKPLDAARHILLARKAMNIP